MDFTTLRDLVNRKSVSDIGCIRGRYIVFYNKIPFSVHLWLLAGSVAVPYNLQHLLRSMHVYIISQTIFSSVESYRSDARCVQVTVPQPLWHMSVPFSFCQIGDLITVTSTPHKMCIDAQLLSMVEAT